ncbi:MAG: AAA family ATPase [Candidatus Sumerlaeota bacterium]|nr:AAA family ATPase [Candidatus Sumerlaeota bacterium]
MYVSDFKIENVKCFESFDIPFTQSGDIPHWITFLGENGCGKSTALQALALLLIGPEGVPQLKFTPHGWLRDNGNARGKISATIQKGPNDPGKFGKQKVRHRFAYSYHVTGSGKTTINNREYSQPAIVESPSRNLSWLRQNAFSSKGRGWFAAGYGAFRRLSRSPQILVPSWEDQVRYTNFFTQFNEDQSLTSGEQWMVFLDYHYQKEKDQKAKRQLAMVVKAINAILPAGITFDSITSEGRILFNANGRKVPTISMSDGYRSVLALAGDLIGRLIASFPKSKDPLKEEGVVIIDELDIHLHPTWQWDIAAKLQEVFPKIQFIVATHSPFIAAGAGEKALTYRFFMENGKANYEKIEGLSSMNIERVLASRAFSLVSPKYKPMSSFAPETQEKIDRYDELLIKGEKRNRAESREYQQLRNFIARARPFGGPPEPGSLQSRIEDFLEKHLP